MRTYLYCLSVLSLSPITLEKIYKTYLQLLNNGRHKGPSKAKHYEVMALAGHCSSIYREISRLNIDLQLCPSIFT
jgi:hypothetical protein